MKKRWRTGLIVRNAIQISRFRRKIKKYFGKEYESYDEYIDVDSLPVIFWWPCLFQFVVYWMMDAWCSLSPWRECRAQPCHRCHPVLHRQLGSGPARAGAGVTYCHNPAQSAPGEHGVRRSDPGHGWSGRGSEVWSVRQSDWECAHSDWCDLILKLIATLWWN